MSDNHTPAADSPVHYFSTGDLFLPLPEREGKGCRFRVWYSGEEAFSLGFGTPGAGLSASVWTTMEGLETVIAACREGLAAKAARDAS